MLSKQIITRAIVVIVLILLAVIIVPNARALYEGIFFYLRDTLAYSPTPFKPVSRNRRYASLYQLVQMRNTELSDYLRQSLASSNIAIVEIPIANSSQPNFLVQFNSSQPSVIFCAHYDKLYDDVNYQGASDNLSAVSVLLAAAKELAQRGDGSNRAFLFTGEEETGLRGSKAFIEYARANNIAIREIVNFDNIGRGKLGIRPSASMPGFIFTVPFIGDYAYDGRALSASPPYRLANNRVTQTVVRTQLNTTVYERFTALSDSNVFEANGIDTVAISGDDMAFLERTWHTYEDKIELIDEGNLDLAFQLVVDYPAR